MSKNIVYVSSPIGQQFGGGEQFIKNFIQTQPQHNHVFIGSSKPMHKVFEELKLQYFWQSGGLEPVIPLNIILIPLSIVIGLINVFQQRELYKKADIIISPTSFTELFFVIPWLRLFFGKKILFMIHNINCPKIFRLPIVRTIVKTFFQNSSTVFVSKSQKEIWREYNILPKNNTVILNGVIISAFTPLKKDTSKVINIGYLGRIDKEKRLSTLIQSLLNVKTKKQVVVNIGGAGPDEQHIKNLLNELTIPQNIKVVWHGFIKENKVPLFYEKNDLMIFPSSRESFGLSLVESWERGVTVITSDIPVLQEIQEIFLKEEQRLTFPLDDVKKLSDLINKAIDNIEQYTSIENQQFLHNQVEKNFSFKKIVENYQQLF